MIVDIDVENQANQRIQKTDVKNCKKLRWSVRTERKNEEAWYFIQKLESDDVHGVRGDKDGKL